MTDIRALMIEIGCGKSKKEAKHNTAVAILKAMNISTKELFGECYGEVDPVEMEDTRAGGSDSGDPSGNPVGLLQELCMKMKLPPPTYCVMHQLVWEDGG
jgi:RISC-loading complex subunit TARBP2